MSLLVIKVGLSLYFCRNRSKANVQRIMEQLGGGGHSIRQLLKLRGQDLMSIRQQLIETIENEVITIEKESNRMKDYFLAWM